MKLLLICGLSLALLGGCMHSTNDFKLKATRYLMDEKARLQEEVDMHRNFVMRTRTNPKDRPSKLDFSQKTELLLERMERDIGGNNYTENDLQLVFAEVNKLYPYVSMNLISLTSFDDFDLDDLQLEVAYLRLFNEVLSSYYQRSLGCASFQRANLFSFSSGKEVTVFYDSTNLKEKLVIQSLSLNDKEIEVSYSSHLNKGSVSLLFDVEDPGTYKWTGEYLLKLHMNFYDTLQVTGEFTLQP